MRKHSVIWLVLGLLALSGLACNLSGLGSVLVTPTPPVPEEAPTAVVVVLTRRIFHFKLHVTFVSRILDGYKKNI